MFTLGGSWSGGEGEDKVGGNRAEVYDGNDWTVLSNINADPILTDDPRGVYRSDNHAWFFGWSGEQGAAATVHAVCNASARCRSCRRTDGQSRHWAVTFQAMLPLAFS